MPAILAAIDHSPQGTTFGEPTPPDFERLLPMLTVDVLVHSWDLAHAVGIEPRLDPELCRTAYLAVRSNNRLGLGHVPGRRCRWSTADPVTLLVSFLGRDPGLEAARRWLTRRRPASSCRACGFTFDLGGPRRPGP